MTYQEEPYYNTTLAGTVRFALGAILLLSSVSVIRGYTAGFFGALGIWFIIRSEDYYNGVA